MTGVIAQDEWAMGHIYLRSLLDAFCEDLAWIAGLTDVGRFNSVWENMKITLGYYAAKDEILDAAKERIRDADPTSLTAILYSPYAEIVNKHDVHGIAFDPLSPVRSGGNKHAHAPAPSDDKLEVAMTNCCTPSDRERVILIRNAHREFVRILNATKQNLTAYQVREATQALPAAGFRTVLKSKK